MVEGGELSIEASIVVDCRDILPWNISHGIYGGFIEYTAFCINGPTGLWAQEIRNRGFDEPDGDNDGVSGEKDFGWRPFLDPGVSGVFELSDGGYNRNGRYSQRVTKISGDGRVGVSQLVFISNTAGLDFYIYIKGDTSVGEINVTIADVNGITTYVDESLGIPTENWSKYEASLPLITEISAGLLEITWKGDGTIWLDEASLMPSDNIGGVRREYYELYKEWQPGVLRYPGGCFADSPANQWIYGVGPIDQRHSPNWDSFRRNYQRMDFGTDEFIAFCKSCNIEPHITVNFGSGTPEDAAAWVEYCNGPVNSTYGAMRAANGHPEPYNVKYWEIGNEQYGDWEIGHTTPEEYGRRFLEFYHAMKAIDPTIEIMADGDKNPSWYKPMMEVIKKDIDLFGWHEAHTPLPNRDDEKIYLDMLSRSVKTEETIKSFWREAEELNLSNNMKLSISEWWPIYRYVDDFPIRLFSLESALWSALHLNVFQRNSHAMETACRTVFIGIIASIFDIENGSRIIFGTPTYQVFKMYSKYSGNYRLSTEVDSPGYIPSRSILGSSDEIPYLDVSATISNKSIYLAVINRHPRDAIQTEIKWNGIHIINAVIHEINSGSYLDANTPDNPDKIKIKTFEWKPKETYAFPPHSVTIIEITNYTNRLPRKDFSRINGTPDFYDNTNADHDGILSYIKRILHLKEQWYDLEYIPNRNITVDKTISSMEGDSLRLFQVVSQYSFQIFPRIH